MRGFREYLRKRIFNRYFLTYAAFGAAFLYFYTYALSYILPGGVNQDFTSWLSRGLMLPVVVLNSLFIILFFRSRKEEFLQKEPSKFFRGKDMVFLLLPLAPVARYIILNYEYMNFFNALVLLAVFSAAAFVPVLLIPGIVGIIGMKRFKGVLMTIGVTLSFMIINMPSLSADYTWHGKGDPAVQGLVFSVFFILVLAGYFLNKRALKAGIVIFFVTSTAVALLNPDSRYLEPERETSAMVALTFNKEIENRPDIFLLTYESYVENETMLQYGIDNSEQEDYLKEQGFHIYRGTYTVGAASLTAMSRVLEVTAPEPPRAVQDYRRATSGDSAVCRILRESGYETYGIFLNDFFFDRRGKGGAYYDYFFPEEAAPTYLLIFKAVIEGVFRYEASFESADYSEYLSEKRRILSSKSSVPRFMYTHNKYPGHSHNFGRALGDEIEIYIRGLHKANEEMRIDVETAIQNNPDAIIIVCGDHGPYLTKNCSWTSRGLAYSMSEINRLDIQDRYGSFLAIRWPDDSDIDHDKIQILQDIFPAVFGHLYDDFPVESARIERTTLTPWTVSGVVVRDGIIEGGINDGEPLFESSR